MRLFMPDSSTSLSTSSSNSVSVSKATFAGGCFWCLEPPFDEVPGVIETLVGYTGGAIPHPTYEQICTGKTGHAEAVLIHFDPVVISYAQLLDVFWKNIDPTTLNRQFADRGTQYRTAIFTHDAEQKALAEASKSQWEASGYFKGEIVTEITEAPEFFPAEDYHQDYYVKCPLRYQAYKQGSGRASYLEKMWGKVP
jgi:methionine-S-sulfoxide reductase